VPHEDENGHVAGFFALGQELSADDSRTLPESERTRIRHAPAL